MRDPEDTHTPDLIVGHGRFDGAVSFAAQAPMLDPVCAEHACLRPCKQCAIELERMTTPAAKSGMAKREFLQQYVLSRTRGTPGRMDGTEVAGEALKAWKFIEQECK